MHRIDTPGATEDGRFKESPFPATRVGADWLNALQTEVETVITHVTGGGAALVKGNNAQLLAAILAMITRAIDQSRTEVNNDLDALSNDLTADLDALSSSVALALAALSGSIANLFVLTTDEATSQRTITVAGGLFILKMGYFRETITSEVTRTVNFATPFPNGCWHAFTQGVIAAASNLRDLWPQVIPPLTTAASFTVQFQADDTNDMALSGFDWWAIGN